MRFVLSLVLLLVSSSVFGETVPELLQATSVTIRAGFDSQGSGSLVTRKIGDKNVTFVWTAAHVLRDLRSTRQAVNGDGLSVTVVEFADPQIVREIVQDGRRVGEVVLDAKVVKYSDVEYGEDLALLMVRQTNAYSLKTTTKFITTPGYVPPIGANLSHCGSLKGQWGSNSYTTGVLSQVGRTRKEVGPQLRVFDQVSTPAFFGSSGGGMYLTETGEYIGMLTEIETDRQGFNYIVPVRRMLAWAKAAGIEWAMNPEVPMPTLEQIEKLPVESCGAAPGKLKIGVR